MLTVVTGVLLACTSMIQAEIEEPRLSVQLWSVRDALKEDFSGTLKSLSEMGFEAVEFAGYFGPYENDAEGLKVLLDSVNLKVSGAHTSFDQVAPDTIEKTAAFYKTLGVEVLVVGWDTRAWDPEKVESLVSDLNAMAKALKTYGMRAGFHNHNYEFGAYHETTFWDYIAGATAEDFVLQLDVGWVTYAGKDPVHYVNKYPGRTLTTHIKAKLPPGTKNRLPLIGQDVTDWPAVIRAELAVGGTEWFVLEQEDYPEGMTPLEAVKSSKAGLDKILTEL